MQTSDYAEFLDYCIKNPNARNWACTIESPEGNLSCEILQWEPSNARFYALEPYEGREEVSSYWDLRQHDRIIHVRLV